MIISFREWLKLLRLDRRLSLARFGKAVGYSAEGIRKYESRGHRPAALFASALSTYLGLNGARAEEFQTFVTGARADAAQNVAEWIVALTQQPRVETAVSVPVALTRLVGRDDDVERGARLLATRGVRLVTFVGPGGTGKTRLALAVAERMRTVYQHGVYFVELAAVGHPHDIEPAIADSLRLKDTAGRSAFEALKDFLGPKQVLLVLDNLEHLVAPTEAAGWGVAQQLVGGLLRNAPRLQVLATSRIKLRITGERMFPVNPLRLPTAAERRDLKTVARNPAVELFVERVADGHPHFTLAESNAAAVADICEQVEGIPLAIEIAAARCDTLDPHTVSALLRDNSRLKILVNGGLDQGPRHQTLRAAIGWSFDLLDVAQQQFFARLGICVGGFTAQTAARLLDASADLGETAERETAGRLGSLVDASLLRVTRDATARYSMLEIVREFALEALLASGEADLAARQHALFFVEWAERVEPELVGRDQATWLTVCETEHPNVRAALRWLLDRHELDLAARLASAVWRFWWTRGHLTAGRGWLEELLRTPGPLHPRLRARVLTADGVLARTQREFERATGVLIEALDLWKHLGDLDGAALALVNLGIVAENLRECDLARERYVECLAYRRQLKDERGEAHVLNNLAVVAIDEGSFDQAAGFGRQSLEIFERLGVDPWGRALVQRNLGWIATAQGRFAEAHAWLDASLAISRALGDPESAANTLNGQALLAYAEATAESGYHVAHALAAEGFRLMYEIGDRAGLAESLEILSACAGELGQPEIAARGLGAAEALRSGVRTSHIPSHVETYRAMVAAARRGADSATWNAAWADGAARPDAMIADTIQRMGARIDVRASMQRV